MPPRHRLYEDLAPLWPLLSPPREYAKEARHVARLMRQKLGRPPRGRRWRLLELGCGGGHSLVHLSPRFDAVGVDRSEPMLTNSRRLNPTVEHVRGDMRDLRLGRVFDAVLIHDAIDYMLTEADLAAAFATAAAHLRQGGVLVVLPDYTRETFVDHAASAETHRGPGVEVAFVSYVRDADPDDTVIQLVMLFLIHEGGRLRVVEDRHACGLFPLGTWLRLLRRSGFEAELHERPVRGLVGEGAAPAIVGVRT